MTTAILCQAREERSESLIQWPKCGLQSLISRVQESDQRGNDLLWSSRLRYDGHVRPLTADQHRWKAGVDHEGDTKPVQSSADRAAVTIAQLQINHCCGELGIVRCEQAGLKISGCENASTGRAQRRRQFQCNQWLILDEEDHTSGETIL